MTAVQKRIVVILDSEGPLSFGALAGELWPAWRKSNGNIPAAAVGKLHQIIATMRGHVEIRPWPKHKDFDRVHLVGPVAAAKAEATHLQ